MPVTLSRGAVPQSSVKGAGKAPETPIFISRLQWFLAEMDQRSAARGSGENDKVVL